MRFFRPLPLGILQEFRRSARREDEAAPNPASCLGRSRARRPADRTDGIPSSAEEIQEAGTTRLFLSTPSRTPRTREARQRATNASSFLAAPSCVPRDDVDPEPFRNPRPPSTPFRTRGGGIQWNPDRISDRIRRTPSGHPCVREGSRSGSCHHSAPRFWVHPLWQGIQDVVLPFFHGSTDAFVPCLSYVVGEPFPRRERARLFLGSRLVLRQLCLVWVASFKFIFDGRRERARGREPSGSRRPSDVSKFPLPKAPFERSWTSGFATEVRRSAPSGRDRRRRRQPQGEDRGGGTASRGRALEHAVPSFASSLVRFDALVLRADGANSIRRRAGDDANPREGASFHSRSRRHSFEHASGPLFVRGCGGRSSSRR